MRIDDCFLLGYFSKSHGLAGEVQAFIDSDQPEAYTNLESLFALQNGQLVPYFIKRLKLNGQQAVLKLEEVDSVAFADGLVGCEIYLPLSALPKLADDQYYYHQLVGLEIWEDDSRIGIVNAIYDSPGQSLLATSVNEKEVLIPITEDIIQEVDFTQKKLRVQLPDGLVDLYMDQ